MIQKEQYFTLQDIAPQAGEMLLHIEELGLIKERRFLPQNSALLVLDMQQVFALPDSHAYIPSFPPIVPGVLNLINLYAARHLPIVFTQHLNTNQDAGLMASWWRDLITVDNPNSALIPELDPSLGLVIRKTRYDAFYNTDLDQILREKNINQVVICGVMTHLCCETSARSAFMHGYEVFFPLDGSATYNRRHHLASAINLAHGFAVPVLINRLIEQFNSLTVDESPKHG